MGKPAARVGDGHECPMVEPNGTPHVGGPVIGPGCATVIIEGKPAATEGDACGCVGPADKITSGSGGVFIGGKPAARSGDSCAHGGVVIGGSSIVLIGESMGLKFLVPTDGFEEPPDKEKIAIVGRAIKDCIVLLEKRLELLVRNDPETKELFVKWFGLFTDDRKAVIVERMERQVEFFKDLTLRKFDKISYEIHYRTTTAQVYRTDEKFTIYLGHPFWDSNSLERNTKEAILLHEVSHFKSLGSTIDHKYDIECEALAKRRPEKALYNADSYAFFVTGNK